MELESMSLITQGLAKEIRVIGCIDHLPQSSLAVKTESLSIENNSRLTRIEGKVFDGLIHLDRLSLKNNSLEFIDDKAFKSFRIFT